MTKPLVLILHWLPDGELARWGKEFPECEFLDARSPQIFEEHFGRGAIAYGLPGIQRLPEARSLRWLQLASAGVPGPLCPVAQRQNLRVTNLAGLYGLSIAEHALCMMLFLSRQVHVAHRNQEQKRWDPSIAGHMRDLHGRTPAIVGLGNIGQHIAGGSRAFGMRAIGCRRRPQPTPLVDRVYPVSDIRAMLGEADYVAVAAPLTAKTEGMFAGAEFQAMRPGTIYINVSRGPVAQEPVLVEALRSGHLAAAGLDVFTVEPLPPEHPFWTMPNVLVSPHYSGDTVNNSRLPAERFVRNLRAWLAGGALEGVVDLDEGY